MKLSILINNYNYAPYVRQSVQSALEQDYEDVEVIVVDDCSTDNSASIIGEFDDRVIKILKSRNAGHAAAFNSGFKACSGDLVMFLDSDDFLYPHAAREMVSTWRPGVAMIQGFLDYVDSEGVRGGRLPADPHHLDKGDLTDTLLRQGRIRSVVTSGLAFDRKILEVVMPVPQDAFRQGADGYLASVVPLFGKVDICPLAVGAYRQHAGNHSKFSKSVAARARWQIEHDHHRHTAIRTWAASRGIQASRDLGSLDDQHMSARLASSRLESEAHPVPDEGAGRVARQGVKLAMAGAQSLPRRMALAAWYLGGAWLPAGLARPAIEWRLMPAARPPGLVRLVRGLKRIVRRP